MKKRGKGGVKTWKQSTAHPYSKEQAKNGRSILLHQAHALHCDASLYTCCDLNKSMV